MQRKFAFGPCGPACAALIAALLAFAGSGKATATEPVVWDPEASKELERALHHMHHVWNSGDIAALKKLMIGDEVLVSFELDPATHAPVRLKSKQEIDGFVDGVVDSITKAGVTTELEMPAVNCRATGSFGVCTEECTIHIKHPDGTVRTDRLWSTAVAVRHPDGWKWIQWQMAVGAPSQIRTPESAAVN